MKNNKELRLGIIGHGFVGKATDWGFHRNIKKFIVDPIYGSTISDLAKFKPDVIFICVPTPMGDEGEQDYSIIYSVVQQLVDECIDSIKVVKSTVLPSILQRLHTLDKKIIYNPEFLREKHANLDFENSEMIILGGDRNISEQVAGFYAHHSRCKTKEYFYTDLFCASLAKYTINTFLASKVLFFNEIKALFENSNTNEDWETFINIVSKDSRIGNSHMTVPGHDGKYGFGGACFPKDSSALIKFSEEKEVNLDVLKSVIKKNNQIRSQYSELDDREKEQNISFDDKI
tara:strand:- start:1057 stop:1920 length:864 start_codon:yes stop_codon:yes gene_type:complete